MSASYFPTLTVSLLAGLAGIALGRTLGPGSHDPAPAPARLAPLEEALARAEQRLATLRAGPPARVERSAPLPRGGPDEAELEQAVERWLAARSPAADEPAAPPRPSGLLPNGVDLATASMSSIVREIALTGFGNDERELLFQKLRELGRIDEYVAEVERLAAESPEDAGLQVALGHAYLQKLFGMQSSPEIGPVAAQADRAFDRALELDETRWDARFSKAVALSNWPAFLGRGSEAIEHFEILIEQQESQPDQPHFALSYLFLGNVLQASGQQREAIETWKDGLGRFPRHEGLMAALAAAGVR